MPAPMTSNSTSNTNLSVNLAPYAGRWIALVRGHVASVGRTASEAAALAKTAASGRLTLDQLHEQLRAGEVKELPIILKADVQGSIEPIVNQLEKLSNDEVKVKILQAGIGTIGESDVQLAIASGAIVVGFSVEVDAPARKLADSEGVDIRKYDIIYKLTDDIQKAITGMLEPVYQEVVLGVAEVRATFKIKSVGVIAGCMVREGAIQRNAKARVRRDGEVIHDGGVSSLKHEQEDVKEVRAGYECGIGLASFQDFKKGDLIELYT